MLLIALYRSFPIFLVYGITITRSSPIRNKLRNQSIEHPTQHQVSQLLSNRGTRLYEICALKWFAWTPIIIVFGPQHPGLPHHHMVNVSTDAPPETFQSGILPRLRSTGDYTPILYLSPRLF